MVCLVSVLAFGALLRVTSSQQIHHASNQVPAIEEANESDKRPLKFLLAGDSTTAPAGPKRCGGGWGSAFLSKLKPETGSTGINLAVCGATSVSYRAQGYWSDVLRNIEKDASAYRTIVTIAFGHNDQKYKLTNVMTLNHLKEFVGDVRAAATPVLVTPLSRTNINPDGTMKRTLLFEAAITREAGVQTDTVVLDLTKASHQQFLADGYERVLTYRRSPGDTTHLTLVGAQVIGGVVCRLFQDGLPDLAGYVEC